jgi:ribonucleotide reductase beta subunit family protein with ferritin-like domain
MDTIHSLVDTAYAASYRPGEKTALITNLTALLKSDSTQMDLANQLVASMVGIPTERCVITAAKLSVLRSAIAGAQNG